MDMKEFDDSLDEQAGTKPKRKTPEEMKQNPNELLDDPAGQTVSEQQKKLDDTWQVTSNTASGEPHHKEPGSGASEGRGDHSWGINDGDKKP